MLTTCCPKCEKDVTLPPGAGPTSRVRCPLCAEEYTLESVYADLPPLLELLDAPAGVGAAVVAEEIHPDEAPSDERAADARGPFDFDQQDGSSGEGAHGDDGDIAIADAEEVAPKSSGFDFGDAAPAASAGTAARPRKKKQGSPVKMIVGVVLGGLMAAPVAQMILWWLPFNLDIQQRDPLEIGRSYPSSLGLFAPAGVRNHTYGESNSSGAQPQPPDKPDNSSRPPRDALANLDETPSSLGRDDLNAALRGGPQADPTGVGGAVSGDDIADPMIDRVDPLAAADGGSAPPPEKRELSVKNAPSFTTAELSAEMIAAKGALPLLEAAVDPKTSDRVAKANEFVGIANKLAEVATFAVDRTVRHREHLDEILAKSSDTNSKRRILGALARRHLENKQRDGNGLIVVGVVQEIRQQGELFETVVALDTTSEPRVSVYGPRDPGGAFQPGDKVVLLGVIVDKPKSDIRGYQGPDEAVVWGGYSQVVPGG